MPKHSLAKLVSRDITQEESFASWGEQLEWCIYLPLAWKMLGNSTFSIASPRPQSINPGWWFMPLHLVTVGLGWTDLARGFQTWREEGYPTQHPVLRLIWEAHGESIEALEIWLRSASGASIRQLLERFNGTYTELAPVQTFSSNAEHFSAVEDYKRRIKGPRTQQGFDELLAPGGYDRQHLEPHFANWVEKSSDFDPYAWNQRIIRVEASVSLAIATLPSMKGILRFLKDNERELLGESIQLGGAWKLNLTIDDLGLILPLQFEVPTGRWYWATKYPIDLEYLRIHYWGNPHRG